MSQNNYDDLKNQIGDLGGESPDLEDTKTTGLGKLKNKTSYGQREDLDSEEQASLHNFLNKSKQIHKIKENEEVNISDGWIPIDRNEMGIRSMFYPESWEFFIKPATVQAIKNWTAIDEERPDVVNRVFNEICKACIKIDTHALEGAGWTQINSWDRFWFVLKIREYTFAKGESKIEFNDFCSECDEDITFNLTSNSLFYEFPDDELIEKYWKNGHWEIDPREYGADHDPITLYTPKLGKDEAIINWATAKIQNKQKIDEVFLKFLIWMLNKPSKDPQMLDRQIHKLYKEYKDWDVETFEFMDDVINNITINPSEKLKVTCPHCGQEATSNVQFPNGIKVLFKTKTTVKKFGSR